MEESDDRLVHDLASAIVGKKFVAPAVILLELIKPLSFVFSQSLLAIAPVLGVWASDTCSRYAAFLEDRRNIERLQHALANGASMPSETKENECQPSAMC
jgi:hypothetical protein